MKKVTEVVRELALPVVEENGCKLWDVEYVREAGQWYLRLYIDKDGGVNILDCEAISRAMSDILDEAVLSRLDDSAAARSFLRSRVVDHRDIGIRVLVEAQQLVEVDVVDEAAACQQDVFLRAVLEEVEVVVEVLEIATASGFLIVRSRQVEEAVMTTGQIPILTGTEMIQDRTRFVRQHDADILDARVHHARQSNVDEAVAAGKRQRFDDTTVCQLSDETVVFLKIDDPHYCFQFDSLRSSGLCSVVSTS